MKAHLVFLATSIFSLMAMAAPSPHHDNFNHTAPLSKLAPTKPSKPNKETISTGPGLGFDVENQEKKSVENILQTFLVQLRSFFNESSFDVAGFQESADNLEYYLFNIHKWARNVKSVKISRRLGFAQWMLGNMTDAVRTLNMNFNMTHSPANYCLYKAIELNVRSLVLYDDCGQLDVDAKGYVERILLIWNSVALWERNFRNLTDVPSNLWLTFWAQLNQVKERLHVLGVQVPKHEIFLF
ncbi:hypothetical protein JCM33374_g6190 [Metschnikowia sp. JCM 33374]|nr:hypothetical protein JCM33374_g6190 [Metschnikowia sp. JCM 33374]